MHTPGHRKILGFKPRLGRAVARAGGLTIGLGAVVLGSSGFGFHDNAPRHDLDVEVAPTSAVAKLMDRFECSTLGLPDGSTPQSSIVRRATGTLEVVTFDEGWDTFTADGADQLVAVCLRPTRVKG